MNNNCFLCALLKNNDNVLFLHSDEFVTAILSKTPINSGHAIVFPNKHFISFSAIDFETLGKMFYLASRIGTAAKRALDSEGYNVIASEGSVAGQDIQHSYLNIIPRFLNDGFHLNWRMLNIEEKHEEIANKIISKLKI